MIHEKFNRCHPLLVKAVVLKSFNDTEWLFVSFIILQKDLQCAEVLFWVDQTTLRDRFDYVQVICNSRTKTLDAFASEG